MRFTYIFPDSWAQVDRDAYLRWNSGQAVSSEELARIHILPRPATVLLDDPFAPDEQLSFDGYGPLDQHKF